MATLFDPLRAGELVLPNRIIMAALTRIRAGATHIPNELMREYYAQRASAGLVITEATMISADGCAFTGEGGLFNDACVEGWQKVTDAVHARGGRIMVQLWHPGRAAHSDLNGGSQPISSTDRPIRNDKIHTPKGEQPYELPRRLRIEEMPSIVRMFGDATARALEARFDGVQIHGAHGYLLDQFLRDSVNDRNDAYGGSVQNRVRLLIEVVDAACKVMGAGRVSVRISPLVAFNDIADSNPSELVRHVAAVLNDKGISFLELRHGDHAIGSERELAAIARREFHGRLFVNGGYTLAQAESAVVTGMADAVVFGGPFVANPDLVARFAMKLRLNEINAATLYSPGEKGYTDYPFA